jgi:glycerol-3-phosphate cytidylyltransferase
MAEPKIVYTGGTFDLFHAGHVNFLKQCKKIGDQVVVALNTDEFIFDYKGKSPIINYEQRKEVLLSCRYVDDVIPNVGGQDSKPTIEMVQPDFIVIGSDWAKKDYYKQMNFTQEWLDENEIVLIYIPYTQGVSTTEIKKLLKN